MLKNQSKHIAREFSLEYIRASRYPSATSRLKGMYVFTDKLSAERAASWGGPFQPNALTEISLAEAAITSIRHDANWITYPDDKNWRDHYWSGQPHPNYEPIWEVLAEGRLVILGTELRNRAFDIIQQRFPDTMVLLETARLAAWVGSNLGNIAAFLNITSKAVELQYGVDMQDANNADFQRKIIELRNSGHPINWQAVQPLIPRGNFIAPDLRPYGFVRPLAEMPYLVS